MRVVSGQAKGLKLQAPKGEATRPTADRCKEALFNILNSLAPQLFYQEAAVLDLCAGSGQIAIEALSRGCRAAILVEQNKLALEAIRTNLMKAKFSAQAQVKSCQVEQFLRKYTTETETVLPRFALVYCDPPYLQAAKINSAVLQVAPKLLVNGGILVLEQAAGLPSTVYTAILQEQTSISLLKEQNYGAAKLLFFRKQADK